MAVSGTGVYGISRKKPGFGVFSAPRQIDVALAITVATSCRISQAPAWSVML